MPRQTLTSYIKRAGDEMLDKIFHFVVAEMNRRKAAKQNVDVGFWDSNGNYTEDIQKLEPEELNRDFGGKSKMIFVNSMSDTFHTDISKFQISKMLEYCSFNKQHIFQILTKRAARVEEFSYPPNVWLGVTVEKENYKNRIEFLRHTDAKIKFLSCEPLLGDLGELDLTGIDWVIAGGESGPGARPMHPDWVRNIQKQCQEQNVPFFFKQWGEWIPSEQALRLSTFKRMGILSKDGSLSYKTYPSEVKKWAEQTKDPIKHIPGVFVLKVGKTNSGAILDGKEYKEFPKILQKE